MSPTKVCLLALFASLALLIRSVDTKAEEAAAVVGLVTLDGKPLAEGKITLHQMDGQFVGARIKDGKFKIDRVSMGKYRMTVESKGVPEKYSSPEHSGIAFEVKSAMNDFQIALTSK